MDREPRETLSFRLDDEIIARIDALAPRLSTLGHDATRSDVIRALLFTGLECLEVPPADDDGAEARKSPRRPR